MAGSRIWLVMAGLRFGWLWLDSDMVGFWFSWWQHSAWAGKDWIKFWLVMAGSRIWLVMAGLRFGWLWLDSDIVWFSWWQHSWWAGHGWIKYWLVMAGSRIWLVMVGLRFAWLLWRFRFSWIQIQLMASAGFRLGWPWLDLDLTGDDRIQIWLDSDDWAGHG